ncbi:hypothetical protein Mag101_11235 [Microbulbifer agarilyticus]|uniref:Dihydrolipoamide acetyltransferase component of pyruvate dehydrogenase complex n=1 Tax=Microbulbifer agarilyticus TaxID=260552 RepID=A0A1Q2M5Z6_9GAMM|nr:dihydrolipoamide acetyltransferase family protein [Microbulbifer agarilyticus]AQQ68144.1 hypothetical protein Mag101_11235 [Microbulbifer agarilyticus]
MSNLKALTVPKWGMSMEEGEITEWRVDEGDEVAVGDEVVDIETSKIINTAESTCNGTLVRIVAQPGEIHRVAMLLGVVAQGEVTDAEIDAFVANFEPDAAALVPSLVSGDDSNSQVPQAMSTENAAPPTTTEPPVVEQSEMALSDGPDDTTVNASSVARRIARAHNINLHNVNPTGRNGRVSKWDVEKAAGISVTAPVERGFETSQKVVSSPDDSRIAATPVARRLAKKLALNLNDIVPTGRRNRVTKEDVENAARLLSGASDFSVQKVSRMRMAIAARLSEAKQTIPHYRVNVEIDIDSLLAQRKYMNGELGHDISVNDFVIKACASALKRVPEVNVQYAGDTVRAFERADISVAVALDGGLVTPVIRNACSKTLLQISEESRDLAHRAHSGALAIDELQGGTFSVSNLGMFGVDHFDAIINAPQAAILAVGAGKEKAVARDGKLASATMMTVSLSCDHRVIDGALAAKFLQSVKGFLENPASMLV